MQQGIERKIARARELLATAHHAAIATVNEDCSPYNSPVFLAHDDGLMQLYWASNPDAQHSQNVARTGQVFVVLYDKSNAGCGLYIRANDAHATEGAELSAAYEVFLACSKRVDKHIPSLEHYQGAGPERIYTATVRQLWVNGSELGADGFIVRDRRYEITQEDLA